MADPICRWRNATPKTICEIVETLPKAEMAAEDFKKEMAKSKWGESFAKTVYQFASQTALYYIDENNIYHPRFSSNISETDAESYLRNWFKNYYVPNPYTRGFEKLDKPIFIVATLEEELRCDPTFNNFKQLCEKILKDSVGELDIFKNVINRYSGSLKIENDKINIIPSGERKMEVNVNRNDKKAFFENFNNEKNSSSYTQNFSQIIYYGVPGSGKSHKINEQTKSLPDEQKMRVVFHPEYTNADFVGQILPVQTNGGLEYPFKAGPFTRILKRALKNPDKPYYLIIEEINRGNAAAIFGDLFQLLDRNSDGWSSYSIENLDINAFIRSEDERYSDKTPPTTKKVGNIEFNENTSLRLPPNLSLLATMNTSDQNVFTLDNAFQRRWDMRLVENQFDDKDENAKIQRTAEIGGTNVTWEQFQTHINKRIGEMSSSMGMSSMEDKRLGCWFVKAEDGKISKEQFAEKVLKYLWDDAFKFSREEIFDIKDKTSSLESIVSAFKNGDESAPCNWTIFKNTSFISQLDNVQAESDVGETE
ncbi:hypothetical protein DYE50_01570 [Treponema ruminis]|nr:hypothetical protein DYE50_01570 [Treponema ruminis]